MAERWQVLINSAQYNQSSAKKSPSEHDHGSHHTPCDESGEREGLDFRESFRSVTIVRHAAFLTRSVRATLKRRDRIQRRASAAFDGDRRGGNKELPPLVPCTSLADVFEVAVVKDVDAHRVQSQ